MTGISVSDEPTAQYSFASLKPHIEATMLVGNIRIEELNARTESL